MAEPREIKVKLRADVDGYVAAMGLAVDATKSLTESAKGLADSLDGGSVQLIRTGAAHRFPRSVATNSSNQGRFVVDPLPVQDFASAALREAQAAYAEKWHVTPEQMADMIWTLRLAED